MPRSAGDAEPDVVVLQDGKRIEGRVVFESDERVVVRVNSKDSEIERAKVASVESVARSLRQALEMWDKVSADDPGATLDLARFCKTRGLEGEANVLGLLVLAHDPENEAAHLLCEHEKRGSGWTVKDGRKKRMFPKNLGTQDWGDAWQLETTHYRLATNLDLYAACSLALELELFYRTFYDWFGPELGLYEVVEPMACQVHADKGSYPEVNNRIAYFDGAKNVLYELAVNGFVLEVLMHEATHQILHNTAVETRGGRGDIPPWVNEGLAEYLSSSRKGPSGHAWYDARSMDADHFACQREARKPYDLARILSLGTGDFGASSKADLKYAQSYSLVHFCLLGDGGAYRAGFMEFLRGVYRGRSSATAFKDALQVRESDFEKAWTAYVQSGG